MAYYVRSVAAIMLIMNRDKPDRRIRHQRYFILVLIVDLNGIKIDISSLFHSHKYSQLISLTYLL